MAVIKIACPKCGQKVSGDHTFYGRSVNCPICTSKIVFPDHPAGSSVDSLPKADSPVPASSHPPEQPPVFDTSPPPSQPSFETIHPSSQPVPTSQPSFETIDPSMQPAPQSPPAFETIAPGMAPPGPSLHESPTQASGAIPQVPVAPDIPPASENEEVPSPMLGAISAVLGVLNVITSCLMVPPLLLTPLAIILGHIGLNRARQSPVKPAPGQTLSLVGVILGYTGLVFTVIFLILALVFKAPLSETLNGLKS